MTMQWMYYSGPKATLDQKLDALERFVRDAIKPLAG
jgi:hypothetical protein